MPNSSDKSKYDNWFKGSDGFKRDPRKDPKKPARDPKPLKVKSSSNKLRWLSKLRITKSQPSDTPTEAGFWTRAFDIVARPFASGPIHHFIRKIAAKPLLLKILYTLLMILIFRVAASITTPGIIINEQYKQSAANSTSFLGILDLMGGGALRNFSLVTLGVSPFITASIVVQLITSEAFPPLHKWTKSGPVGKRKINIMTRFITLAFAILQAVTIIQQLTSGNLALTPGFDTVVYKYVAIPIILIAGSFFTLFLGEQITNRGVGNGTSLIIFSGIAYNLPYQFQLAYSEIVEANPGQSTFIGGLNFAVYVAAFLFLIWLTGFLYLAERRIPIQQTGSGLQMDRAQLSFLPIKLNPAGVMPIIFSLALSVLPVTVVQFLHHQNEGRIWVEQNMRLTQPIGLSIFIGLTFIFTIVMSFVTFNPYTVADGFKKSGTFIPGVRPGDETERYLLGVILRLALFSAFYLSAISAIQYVQEILGLSPSVSFGGTTMIILVSVALETTGQLQARDKTYKIAKARRVSVSQTGKASPEGEGLLW